MMHSYAAVKIEKINSLIRCQFVNAMLTCSLHSSVRCQGLNNSTWTLVHMQPAWGWSQQTHSWATVKYCNLIFKQAGFDLEFKDNQYFAVVRIFQHADNSMQTIRHYFICATLSVEKYFFPCSVQKLSYPWHS